MFTVLFSNFESVHLFFPTYGNRFHNMIIVKHRLNTSNFDTQNLIWFGFALICGRNGQNPICYVRMDHQHGLSGCLSNKPLTLTFMVELNLSLLYSFVQEECMRNPDGLQKGCLALYFSTRKGWAEIYHEIQSHLHLISNQLGFSHLLVK